MQINLTELFPVEGKSKTYTIPLEMTCFQAAGGSYEIGEKEPVQLTITNRGDKILEVEGKAVLSLLIPCARCLEPVRVPFELTIEERLDMKRSEEERIRELDEQFYVKGYNLDVDQLVGNELMLNLPMRVLCSESCGGIDSRYGTDPNRQDPEADRPLDPRMSVIQDIFKQSKEV